MFVDVWPKAISRRSSAELTCLYTLARGECRVLSIAITHKQGEEPRAGLREGRTLSSALK
jgi:hypothetical protein